MREMELLDELPEKSKPRRNLRWAEEAKVLRDNPGKWLLVAPDVKYTQVMSALQRGAYPVFTPTQDWEFAGRNGYKLEGKSMADIYVRYVGSEPSDETIHAMQQSEPQPEQTDTPETQPTQPDNVDPYAAFYNQGA